MKTLPPPCISALPRFPALSRWSFLSRCGAHAPSLAALVCAGLRVSVALGQEAPLAPVAPPSAIAPLPPVAAPEPAGPALAPEAVPVMANRPIDDSKELVKPGTGFYWQSVDGDFSFAPRLRAQFLYTLEDAAGQDLTQAVELRRARLQFKGNFYGKANKFKVEFAVSPGDVAMSDGEPPGTSILLDWYLDFAQLRDLTLRVGQYKIPHNRQRVISSGDLEFVDRSIVNAEFTLDRDIGVDLHSDDLFGLDLLRYYLGVYAGEGRNTRGDYDLGLLYLARVELLPFGMFDDYVEGDLERVPTPKLSLGLGAAHLRNARFNRGILGNVPSDGGTTDVNSLTVDAIFRLAGFSANTEWIFRDGDRELGAEGPLEPPRDGYGGMLQLSYLLPATWLQVAARYAFIEPTGDVTSLPASTELGAALSYYFAHHPFKLQGDFFRLGREDGGDTSYDYRFRLQLQASY